MHKRRTRTAHTPNAMARRVVGMTVALALIQFGCGMLYPRHGVAHHVRKATGQRFTECGTFRFPLMVKHELTVEQAQRASVCLNETYAKKEPFAFWLEGPGRDSVVAEGLLLTRSGDLQRFWYDSAPCGGPYCRERFNLSPCTPPAGHMLTPTTCKRP